MTWNPATSAGRPKASDAAGTPPFGNTVFRNPSLPSNPALPGTTTAAPGRDEARRKPAERFSGHVGQRAVRQQGDADLVSLRPSFSPRRRPHPPADPSGHHPAASRASATSGPPPFAASCRATLARTLAMPPSICTLAHPNRSAATPRSARWRRTASLWVCSQPCSSRTAWRTHRCARWPARVSRNRPAALFDPQPSVCTSATKRDTSLHGGGFASRSSAMRRAAWPEQRLVGITRAIRSKATPSPAGSASKARSKGAAACTATGPPVRDGPPAQRLQSLPPGPRPVAPDRHLGVPGPLALAAPPGSDVERELERLRSERIHGHAVVVASRVHVHLVREHLETTGGGDELQGRYEGEVRDRSVSGDEQDEVRTGPPPAPRCSPDRCPGCP